ncbi:FAD assembly factor SdhE [Anaplasma capra]|uniref:FAD assembly factor SdhE n=1 Tax=Anaplasma capra TaxID=1562740 RepID=UPI0021D5B65D|nr:succinate dehydrogenase assembly factor 2 [Anaplasma capra]MCU7611276.1 succinate dehydrogenase assembly factor 2 [Anaplasma capra]MCU7612705.1 succinate dehydrogenase assembly factor 2 [Anaplasma capra]
MNDLSLEERKRKLFYRSTHRGCKETDILLGGFAGRYLPLLSAEKLEQYERIVELDDDLLYSYIVGSRLVPSSIDKELVALIAAFAVDNK